MNTEKIQRCGCEEDDCVEILGLESPLYVCFTCGYAGVTPSGADNHEDEIHIGDLLAEVKRLREESSILKNAFRSLLKDKHAEVWYEVSRILEGDEEKLGLEMEI